MAHRETIECPEEGCNGIAEVMVEPLQNFGPKYRGRGRVLDLLDLRCRRPCCQHYRAPQR